MTAPAPRPAPYPSDTLSKGWRFELNMETVKKSETWLRARNGLNRARLLLLWAESWEQTPCGSLPNDDELLSLLLDIEPEDFAKSKALLMRGWWLADDGRLYHETITERVLAMIDKRMSDAQRAARSRANRAASAAGNGDVTGASRVTHVEVGSEFDTKHQNQNPDTSTSGNGEEERGSSSSEQSPDGGRSPGGGQSKQRKKHGTEDDHKAVKWMFHLVRKVDATAKEPNWDAWANEMRLMREQDGRTHREACELFEWANKDTFWCANILSPAKLREQWQQLTVKRAAGAGGIAIKPVQLTDAARQAANDESTEEALRILRARQGGGEVIEGAVREVEGQRQIGGPA